MLNNINSILSLSFRDRKGNKLDTNDILMQYIDDDNAFVSFTEIDKIGIRTDSKYDTPLGIYCYPIKLAYEFYTRYSNKFIENLPFATDKKYFTIFKAKNFNKIITDYNYTDNKFYIDFNNLKKYIIKKIKKFLIILKIY